MSVEDCLHEGKMRRSSPDIQLAKSMLSMSNLRLEFLNKQVIDDKNASILMSEYYEALREVFEAIMSIKGFKSYSHECITHFIKEILKEDVISEKFDRYRKIRNRINYYGKQVSKNETENASKEIKKIISILKNKYKF